MRDDWSNHRERGNGKRTQPDINGRGGAGIATPGHRIKRSDGENPNVGVGGHNGNCRLQNL